MSFVGIHLNPFSLPQWCRAGLFSLCILALLAGCEQAKSPSNKGGEALVPEKKIDKNRVTAAQAEKFAKQYLSAIKRPDTQKLLQLLDWDTIVDRIFIDLSTDGLVYREFSSGGKKILGKFAKGVRQESEGDGSYMFLKTVRRGKDRHAIFRLVTGSKAPGGGGRINYHNLRLIKVNGKVRADDIYVARQGAWFSESYRAALQPVVLQNEKPAVGFTTGQQEEMKRYGLVADVIRAAQGGNHAEAATLYQQLPEDLKKTKSVLVARMLATERDEFFSAAEDMMTHYPNSPSLGLHLMDFGLRNQDMETMKRAGDMLAKWTAGDPYIDLNMAAIIFLKGEDADAALEIVKKIDVREFDFRYPAFLKFNLALKSKDNALILECCRILRDDYDEDMKELLKSDTCQEFRESLEYVDFKND